MYVLYLMGELNTCDFLKFKHKQYLEFSSLVTHFEGSKATCGQWLSVLDTTDTEYFHHCRRFHQMLLPQRAELRKGKGEEWLGFATMGTAESRLDVVHLCEELKQEAL